MEVAEEEELPIIEFNFEIPLLYFRFPSGFGRVKVMVIVPPSEENEAGRIIYVGKRFTNTQPPVPPNHLRHHLHPLPLLLLLLQPLLLLLSRNSLNSPLNTFRS